MPGMRMGDRSGRRDVSELRDLSGRLRRHRALRRIGNVAARGRGARSEGIPRSRRWAMGSPLEQFPRTPRRARSHTAALDTRTSRTKSGRGGTRRSEEHTSELQSLAYLVCRLLLEKKNKKITS